MACTTTLAKGEFNRPDAGRAAGVYVELYKVTSTTEVSRAEFALSGKVTRLGLAGQNLLSQFFGSGVLRQTTVYAQSEALALAPHPIVTPVGGDTLPLAVAAEGLNIGRKLVVKGVKDITGLVSGSAADATPLVHQATITAVTAIAAAGAAARVTTISKYFTVQRGLRWPNGIPQRATHGPSPQSHHHAGNGAARCTAAAWRSPAN